MGAGNPLRVLSKRVCSLNHSAISPAPATVLELFIHLFLPLRLPELWVLIYMDTEYRIRAQLGHLPGAPKELQKLDARCRLHRAFFKHLSPTLAEQNQQAFCRSGIEAFQRADSGLHAVPTGGPSVLFQLLCVISVAQPLQEAVKSPSRGSSVWCWLACVRDLRSAS